MSIFAELRRRNVFRMALLYIVGSWLILQIGDLLFDLMGLPDVALRIVLGILVLGLPVALVFSWAFELTPEGIKREADVDRSASIAPRTGHRLNLVTLAVAAVAIGLMLFQQFGGPGDAPAQRPAETTESAASTSSREPEEKSIAVLPFRDMSAAGDQDYFAEGIAEELLNALVRIEGLRVASRTSSFSFKDQGLDLPAIAERLGVSHLLEGSIRTAGDRVRITAQLIDVPSDTHLWSDTYDRKMDDIFAIQDDITAEVLAALKVHLGGDSRPPSRQVLTENTEAYRLYLRGRHQWRMRNAEALSNAIDLLSRAVALDPGFARAWSTLAVATYVIADYDPNIRRAEAAAQSLEAAQKALELDPEIGEALALTALVHRDNCNWVEADRHFRRALAVDPNDPSVHHWYSNMLRDAGYVEASFEQIRRAFELDPLNASVVFNLGQHLFNEGELEQSVATLKEAAELGLFGGSLVFVGLNLALVGQLDRAEPYLRDLRDFSVGADPGWVDDFLAVMSDPTASQSRIDGVLDKLNPDYFYLYRDVMLAMNSPRILDGIAADCQVLSQVISLWREGLSPLRNHPRFESIMETTGLPELWRERGFPKLCRETASGFECD